MDKMIQEQFDWLKGRERYGVERVDNWLDKVKYVPLDGVFPKCENIKSDMRIILIDWMYGLVGLYKLSLKTIQHAINIADRHITVYPNTRRTRYMAVGIVSLVVSEKGTVDLRYFRKLWYEYYSLAELERMKEQMLELDAGLVLCEFSRYMTYDDMCYVIYSPRYVGCDMDKLNEFFWALCVIKRFFKVVRNVVWQRNQLFYQMVMERYGRYVMLNVKKWVSGLEN